MNLKIAAPAAAAMLGLTFWTFTPSSKSANASVAEAKPQFVAADAKNLELPPPNLPVSRVVDAPALVKQDDTLASVKPAAQVEMPIAKPDSASSASSAGTKPSQTKKNDSSSGVVTKKDDTKKNGDDKKGNTPKKASAPPKPAGAGNRGVAKKQPPPKAPPKGKHAANKKNPNPPAPPNNGGN